MFLNYQTQGLIFKKEDRGEADRLFTIYTKDFGKLKVLAKSVRKISSKLRAGVEIFYLSEIEFIQGKAHKTLTGAVLIEKFGNLKKDLEKLKIAYQIAKITDEFMEGESADEKIWDLLVRTFRKLNNYSRSSENLQAIYHNFLLDFFCCLGYGILPGHLKNMKSFTKNSFSHILAAIK